METPSGTQNATAPKPMENCIRIATDRAIRRTRRGAYGLLDTIVPTTTPCLPLCALAGIATLSGCATQSRTMNPLGIFAVAVIGIIGVLLIWSRNTSSGRPGRSGDTDDTFGPFGIDTQQPQGGQANSDPWLGSHHGGHQIDDGSGGLHSGDDRRRGWDDEYNGGEYGNGHAGRGHDGGSHGGHDGSGHGGHDGGGHGGHDGSGHSGHDGGGFGGDSGSSGFSGSVD